MASHQASSVAFHLQITNINKNKPDKCWNINKLWKYITLRRFCCCVTYGREPWCYVTARNSYHERNWNSNEQNSWKANRKKICGAVSLTHFDDVIQGTLRFEDTKWLYLQRKCTGFLSRDETLTRDFIDSNFWEGRGYIGYPKGRNRDIKLVN